MATKRRMPRRARKPASAPRRVSRRATKTSDPITAPIKGAERREIGHVRLEVVRAGAARVKRMIYPRGFRWSKDMKPIVKSDRCMHAHVGFLVRGEIHMEYA